MWRISCHRCMGKKSGQEANFMGNSKIVASEDQNLTTFPKTMKLQVI